jgi:CubicO group peptidase (beta-lactamase class C family)
MDNKSSKPDFSSEKLAVIPPMLQNVVDAGDLSGFVTLLFRKGEIAQVNTIGHRDIATKAPMTRDTLFRIASMTKPVTSVAALMLMEEGKLRLEDPVTKWAPELADLRVLKKADGPLDETYPAPRAITIEDLFTHRAGLSYGFSATGPIAKAYDKALGDPLNNSTTPDAWLKALGTLPLLYAPGERLHYSVATDVLGFIVGRVEKTSFREVLMERLFGPLGMPDTDFYIPKEKRNRLATVYRQDQQTGALNPLPFALHDTPPAFCGGGGGLISTADDYLKFARMMMNKGELDGRRYLKPETVTLMCTNRLTPGQRAIPLLGAIPMWDGMGFGLGVSIIDHPEKLGFLGMGAKGAFGWPGAFGTWWQADPANDLIMLYLIQNSTPLEPGSIAMLAAGQRMGARAALPIFQRLVYDALM